VFSDIREYKVEFNISGSVYVTIVARRNSPEKSDRLLFKITSHKLNKSPDIAVAILIRTVLLDSRNLTCHLSPVNCQHQKRPNLTGYSYTGGVSHMFKNRDAPDTGTTAIRSVLRTMVGPVEQS